MLMTMEMQDHILSEPFIWSVTIPWLMSKVQNRLLWLSIPIDCVLAYRCWPFKQSFILAYYGMLPFNLQAGHPWFSILTRQAFSRELITTQSFQPILWVETDLFKYFSNDQIVCIWRISSFISFIVRDALLWTGRWYSWRGGGIYPDKGAYFLVLRTFHLTVVIFFDILWF